MEVISMAKIATSKKDGQLKKRFDNFLKSSHSLSLTDWHRLRHDQKLMSTTKAFLEIDLSGWKSAINAYQKRHKKDAWNRQKPVEYDVEAISKVYEIQAEILRKQGILDEMNRVASIKTVKKKISKR
jgi:hypothetical protein